MSDNEVKATDTPSEAAMRRVRKLLALSENNPNPHEAAAALGQAQKLMKHYGLEMGALERSTITESRVQGTRGRTPSKWENWLARTCCRAFGGAYLWAGGPRGGRKNEDNGHFIFLAQGQKAELISYTFAVFSRQLLKARAQFIAENTVGSYRNDLRVKIAAEADAFCEAYVGRVYSKITEAGMAPAEKAALEEVVAERVQGREPFKPTNNGQGSLKAAILGDRAGAEAQFYNAAPGAAERLKLEGQK